MSKGAWGLVGAVFAAVLVSTWLAVPPSAQQLPARSPSTPALDSTERQILDQLQQMNRNLTGLRLGFKPALAPPVEVLVRGFLPQVDPCFFGPGKMDVAISQTATTRLVVGQPGQRIYVCSSRLVAGVAEIPSFTEGTGANCATGTSAVSGSTTAANGESYAANGGHAHGVGIGSIMLTNKPGDDLCLQQSGSSRVSGVVVATYGFGTPQ